MRKGGGSEGRLSGKTGVDADRHPLTHRPAILGGRFHHQVVRMLAIVQGHAATRLAGLQQVRIPAAADRERLERLDIRAAVLAESVRTADGVELIAR